MSDPPTPPEDLPAHVVEALSECPPALLRQTVEYADALATYREGSVEDREEQDTDADRGTSDSADSGDAGSTADDHGDDDRPDGVPGKATVTVKEINDNRYYYWQWREGDRVRSKYKGPVAPDE